MNRKKLLRAIVIAAAVAVTGWLVMPAVIGRVIRSKAKDRGWDLDFKTMEWSRSQVRLHGVRASNAWLRAEIDDVELSVDGTELKAVRARGGKAEVDLARRVSGEGKSSLKTSAEGLNVEVRGLCGDGRVQAAGVAKGEDGQLSAERVSGLCHGWFLEAEDARRTGNSVRAGRVLVKRGESAPMTPEPKTGSGPHLVDRLAEIPEFRAELGELRLETPSGYLKAVDVKAAPFPGKGSGLDQSGIGVDAESVMAEGPPELGEFTAKHISAAVIHVPMILGGPHVLVQFHAKSVGGGLDALAKDKLEAKMVSVEGTLDEESLRKGIVKDDMLVVRVGDVQAMGTLWYKDRQNFSVHAAVPKTECQVAVDSSPGVFVDKLAGFKMSGTFEPEVHVDGKDGKFDVKLAFKNKCRIDKVPDSMSVKVFSKKFKRSVPGLKGDIEVESGLGSEAWVALDRISPYMVKAVMTTEDTGFFVHKGFVEQSIANSMKENLEKDKFARGGSTVTMQLAKNLWLSRTKTISRKAQEFFLTTYLEQSLTKQEIMELYLNVIEFGPEVYGIRHASVYYFNKNPIDLTVGEAAFLASILPSPKREHFSKEGKLKDGWDTWVKTIVKTMRKRELISEQEETEGLGEDVTKGESLSGGLSPVTVLPGGVDPRSWH